MLEYRIITVNPDMDSAKSLIELFNNGWQIVDKMPYCSEGSYSNIRQYYVMSRTETAKQLFEKSSK